MLESGNKKILIIVPHSDDEVLGCGGFIEKAIRYGNSVKVIVGAIGDTFHVHQKKIITSEVRKEELKNGLAVLGCTDFEILYNGMDSLMDTVPQLEMVSLLDDIFARINPTIVLIPYPSFHQDHKAWFEACMASLRPTEKKKQQMVAMYEYPNIIWQYPKLTDVGELYVDITDSIDLKIEALMKHESQIRNEGHPISPENVRQWAKGRGFEAGVQYAEKMHLLRLTI